MLKRGAWVALVWMTVACTTTSTPEADAGGDPNNGGGIDAAVNFPSCGGEPCDGVCAVDFGTLEAYCAQRCGTTTACRDTNTTCTALGGETACLRPLPKLDASVASSSGGAFSSSQMPDHSSSMAVVDAGEPDSGPADAGVPDAAEPPPDAGYTALVWLTNRCHLARVTIHGEKVCTAQFTAVSTATVTGVRLSSDSPAALRILGTHVPATVNPGDLFSVAVVANPTATGSLNGTIIIVTSDGGQARLPVTGDAVAPAVETVPFAVVKADGRTLAAGASARPTSLVVLDGTQSKDETGAAATGFIWRLVQTPTGAPATLATATEARTLVVPINGSTLSVGDYVAGLRVLSSAGDPGPEQLVPFHVAALEDLVVELTWDQKDTDLDLFLFRGGNVANPSFTPGQDNCSAANCTVVQPGPRWDGANPPRTGGNPLHQGNVTAGFGPERIVVGTPLAGQFVVGVKYNADFNLGVSSALVRVTWRGKLIAQARRGLARAGDTWVALRITLPDGTAEFGPASAPTFCSPRCSGAQTCVSGNCQAISGATSCQADADCPAFNACLSGRCVDIEAAPRCLSGCPQGTRCLGESICVPDAPCTENAGATACFGNECNAVDGRCLAGTPPECLQNACETQLSCVGGFCRECSSDVDCGHGTVCDGLTGRCVGAGCLKDADCGSGRLCDTRHGGCTLPECSVDLECQATDTRRLCDGAARRCYLPPATCATDADEPNNDVATATVMTQSNATGTLCRADVDYLRIHTLPAQVLHVSVAFQPTGGQQTAGVTAELRSLDGRLLAGGVLGTDQATLELASLTAGGSDQILVLGGFGTTVEQWTYSVTVTQETLPACINEPGEPNNGFTLAENSPLTTGSMTRYLCTPDDVDHHFIRVEASSLARFKLTFNPAEGDLGVSILGLGGTVLTTRTGAVSPLIVERATTQAETLVVLVEPSGAPRTTAPRQYTLNTSVSYIPNCAEDAFELNATGVANNIQGQATSVGTGTFNGVACSTTDEDWYRFILPVGQPGPLTVTLSWPVTDDFLDLAIRTSAGQVAASTTAVNPRVITLSNVAANSAHFIQVKPKQPAGLTFRALPYTLTITAPTYCSDDAAEAAPGDDTANSAQRLRDVTGAAYNRTVVGKLCPQDPDFYRVVANTGETVRVTLANLAGAKAELFGPDGTTKLGEVLNGAAAFSYVVTGNPGSYFVKVSGPDASQGAYAVTVDVLVVVPACIDDSSEANGGDDSVGRATVVRPNPAGSFNQQFSGVACTADPDFFSLVAVQQEDVTVTLTGGDATATLLGPDGTTVLATATSGGAAATYNVPIPAGTYYVRVTANTEGAYTLRLAAAFNPCATPAGTLGEPNETSAAAFANDLMGGVDAALCALADVDFYAISVTTGVPGTLTLGYDATSVDLDVRVLDSMGLMVAEDVAVETGTGASVVLPLAPSETATWTVQVLRKTGTLPSANYHLQLAP